MPGYGIAQAIIYIRAVDMVTRPLQTMTSSFARAGATIAQVGMKMTQAGMAMSAAITFPVAAAVVGITKATVEFDKQMRQFQSISKQSDAEVASLGQRLIAMSTDMAQTVAPASELWKAMYEIQSASFTASEAEKILAISTKLASATLSDQEETATTLATVINSYGRDLGKVSEYADMMARGIDIGVFKMGDLNESFGEVTALAYQIGIPMQDLIASLTTMTKKGIGFSEAVTSIRRVMMAYLKPAKGEVDLAKQYGIVLSSNTIKTKGLAGAIEQLTTNTGGNVDVMAKIIGEMRAIRGIMALGTGGGMEMFKGDITTLSQSLGTVEQIYATMTKSVAFQLETLRNKVVALALKLGEILLPMIITVADKIGVLVDKFTAASPTMQRFVVMFALTAAAIGPVLIIVGQLVTGIGAIVAVIGTVAGAVAIFAGSIVAMIGLFEAWRVKTSLVRETMDELAVQPGFLGGMVAAVQALFTELDKVGGVAETFKSSLASIATVWNSMPSQIDLSWASVFAGVLKLLAFLIITISTNIIGAGLIISNVVDRIVSRVGVMGYYVESELNELQKYLDEVGFALNDTGADAFSEMGKSIDGMIADIGRFVGTLWTGLIAEDSFLSNTAKTFDTFFTDVGVFLAELGGPVVDAITKAFSDIADGIGLGLARAVAFIEHTVDNLIALIGVVGAVIKDAASIASLDINKSIAARKELNAARANYDEVRGRPIDYYLGKSQPPDTGGVAGANQALAQSAQLAAESIRGMAGVIPSTIGPPAAGMGGPVVPDLSGVAGSVTSLAESAKTMAGSRGGFGVPTTKAATDFASAMDAATKRYQEATAALPVLSDPRWDKSKENKKFADDMLVLLKNQIDATKDLAALDLASPLEAAMKAWKLLQYPAMGPTGPTPVQKVQQAIPGMPSFAPTGWNALPGFAEQQQQNAADAAALAASKLKKQADDAAAAAALGLGTAADGTASKLTDLQTGIKGVLDEVMSYSKNLGDFGLGAGGGNPLTDPNGPFAAIWRIQDVAQHSGVGRTEGVNTKEFRERYFPGMTADQAQVAAAAVGQAFLNYNWTPAIQALFGPGWKEAIMAQVQAQGGMSGGIAPGLQKIYDMLVGIMPGAVPPAAKPGTVPAAIPAIPAPAVPALVPTTPNAAAVAAQSEMGKKLASSPLFDMSESALIKLAMGEVTPEGVKSIIEPAMPVLVTGLKNAISDNKGNIQDTGKDFWRLFGEGITKQAESDGNLRKVVEAIVLSLLGDKD